MDKQIFSPQIKCNKKHKIRYFRFVDGFHFQVFGRLINF